jgi:hypothetical protein
MSPVSNTFFGSLILIPMLLVLPGCGDSCESVQEEIMQIGREINQNRDKNPWDRAEELQELRNKYQELGCMGKK